MAKKNESYVSPLGEAKWAHIHKPKAPFEGVGEGKYQIDVVFEKGGEWDELGAKITAIVKENDYKNTPIKQEKNKVDELTGRFFITFKTGVQYPPKVFDKNGQVIPPDVLVGNGSTVRVNYTINEYPGFGGGVNFYFNAVQVVDLQEYSGGSASDYGFPVEEDESNPFNDADSSPDPNASQYYDGPLPDDIPF